MSARFPTLCKERGCLNRTTEGYCGQHAAVRDRTHVAAAWSGWYSLGIWRRLRLYFSAHYPEKAAQCQERDANGVQCTRVAVDVDHVIPHRGDWKLFTDVNNLQGLCREHHSAKTAREVLVDR